MSRLFTRVALFLFLGGLIAAGIWSYTYAPLPARIRSLAKQLAKESESNNFRAQRSLRRIGERALPALERMLSHRHWKNRRAAAQALAVVETREQAARKALQDALHDQEWRVRKMAAYALGQKGWYSASAVHALTSALLREKEWQVRREIAQALGRIGPAARHATGVLKVKLRDKDWSVRTAALRALLQINLRPQNLLPALEQTLADPNWQVREIAAQITSQVGAVAFVMIPELQRLTRDSRTEVRRAATASLQQMGGLILAQGLMSKHENRRHVALRDLQQWGTRSPIFLNATFITLTKGKLPGGRALLGIVQSFVPPSSAVPSNTGQTQYPVERNAVHHLLRLGKLSVLAAPSLHAMLRSLSPRLRWAAAHTLANLPPVLPNIRELLKHKQTWVRRTAINVAQQLGSSAVLVLSEALSHSDPYIRLTAARALGQGNLHVKVRLKPLVQRLKDSNLSVRLEAAHSLMQLGDAGQKALLAGMEKLTLNDIIQLIGQTSQLPVAKLSVKKRSQILIRLMRFLRTGQDNERLFAVKALQTLAPSAGPLLPELRTLLLKDNVVQIRRVAAMTLATLGKHNKAALKPLREALRTSSDETRGFALDAMFLLGSAAQAAVPELVKAVHNPTTRQKAILALSRMKPEVAASLAALGQDSKAQVRWSWVEILSRLQPRTPAIVQSLQKATKDTSHLVRLTAQYALSQDNAGQTNEPAKAPTSRPAAPTSRPAPRR